MKPLFLVTTLYNSFFIGAAILLFSTLYTKFPILNFSIASGVTGILLIALNYKCIKQFNETKRLSKALYLISSILLILSIGFFTKEISSEEAKLFLP